MPAGSKPGERRGGRPKGVLNKKTVVGFTVAQRLEELGFDPIQTMVKIAANPKNPVDLRGKMSAELLQYLHPKRKSMEVTQDIRMATPAFVVEIVKAEEEPK